MIIHFNQLGIMFIQVLVIHETYVVKFKSSDSSSMSLSDVVPLL